MAEVISGGEVSLFYVPKFREYALRIFDGGSSYLGILFCPWCGRKLPDDLRTQGSITNMKVAQSGELRFLPAASEFIIGFFSEVK